MKKDELAQYVAEEIADIVNSRGFSNENDTRYYKRKADGLVDMLLGFGMTLPAEEKNTEDGCSSAVNKAIDCICMKRKGP